MERFFQYGEIPYSKSETIKKTKGWFLTKDKDWCFDVDFSTFSCSTNWCCGSVITGGWELYIELGPYMLSYLNRVEIKPPESK